MTFCTDVDLLHWEPNLGRDAAFASQTLISGTGDLAGTLFTLASGSFLAAHVTPDQVIALGDPVAGCYPIVSVDGAAQLTISALHDGLFPADGSAGIAAPAGEASGVSFAVRTFWPQRRIVSELLLQACGLDPGDPASADRIINPLSLKHACGLGTLHAIYGALAAAAEKPANLIARAELYQHLYRRALRSARAELDLDGDGKGDVVRALNVLELHRL